MPYLMTGSEQNERLMRKKRPEQFVQHKTVHSATITSLVIFTKDLNSILNTLLLFFFFFFVCFFFSLQVGDWKLLQTGQVFAATWPARQLEFCVLVCPASQIWDLWDPGSCQYLSGHNSALNKSSRSKQALMIQKAFLRDHHSSETTLLFILPCKLMMMTAFSSPLFWDHFALHNPM